MTNKVGYIRICKILSTYLITWSLKLCLLYGSMLNAQHLSLGELGEVGVNPGIKGVGVWNNDRKYVVSFFWKTSEFLFVNIICTSFSKDCSTL